MKGSGYRIFAEMFMKELPKIPDDAMLRKLEPPKGKIPMVLDTDTYNEVDDQFALVHAILSDELDVEAVHAAPFYNNRSTGPGDGMEKSYEEILRILDLMEYKHTDFVFRGSRSYLPAPGKPVESEAAEHLIQLAMADRDGLLYVVAIGAITNVVSAIMIEPEIIDRILVVWLGGQPHYWPRANDFNLGQDLPASKFLFDCGVPLVHIPCTHVSEYLRTTLPEIELYVKGRGPLGDYLYETFASYWYEHEKQRAVKAGDNAARADHFAWSKVIWDISGTAWLVNPNWVPTNVCHAPILTTEVTWSHRPSRHFMRVGTRVNRDAVFGDLFRKIEKYSSN